MDRHNKGTESFIGKASCFPLLFNYNVPVELIASRAFGSLIMQYETMRHGIYEIPPFGINLIPVCQYLLVMSRYRFLLRHCVHVVVVQPSYRFAVRQIIPAVVVDCVYVTVQNHVIKCFLYLSPTVYYIKKKKVQVKLQLKIFKTVFTCSSSNLRNYKLDLTFAACLQCDSKSPNYSCCLMRDFRYGQLLVLFSY